MALDRCVEHKQVRRSGGNFQDAVLPTVKTTRVAVAFSSSHVHLMTVLLCCSGGSVCLFSQRKVCSSSRGLALREHRHESSGKRELWLGNVPIKLACRQVSSEGPSPLWAVPLRGQHCQVLRGRASHRAALPHGLCFSSCLQVLALASCADFIQDEL